MKNSRFKVVITALAVTTILVSTYAGDMSGPHILNYYRGQQQLPDTTGGQDQVEIVGSPTTDDPWKEMTKLIDAYYVKSGIEYSGSIKLIDDNGEEETVVEEHDFHYTLFDNNYYHYTMGDHEVVSNPKFILTANHSAKTIYITRNLQSGPISLFNIDDFRKMMEQKKANILFTQAGEEKVITIDHIDDINIQGYRIYYSPKTYRINKMLIGMVRPYAIEEKEESKNVSGDEEEFNEYYYYLEVIFKSASKLSPNNKLFQPESKYIRISNGRIELAPEANGYELLNTIAL